MKNKINELEKENNIFKEKNKKLNKEIEKYKKEKNNNENKQKKL